jgi:hypothetical protein
MQRSTTVCSNCNREYPADRECPFHGPSIRRQVKTTMKTLKTFALIAVAVAAFVAGAELLHGQSAPSVDAKPAATAPSNDSKDAEIARLKQEIAKRDQELTLWKQKYQGLLSVYGADEALKGLEAQQAPAPAK